MQIKPHAKCRSYKSYTMAEESADQFFKSMGETAYQRISWAVVPVDIGAVGLEGHRWTMVREMSEYLIKTTLRLSREWKKNTGMPQREVIDFRRGCMVRLTERVREMWHAQSRANAPVYTSAGNPGNLPALYGREVDLIKAYGSKHFNLRWVASNTKIKMGAAAAEGRRAADTVSFSKQVGAASRSSYMIGSK